MMTWSEFFGFLAILIELFKFFFRVLRFVIKMSKKKSNRSGLKASVVREPTELLNFLTTDG